MAQSFVTVHVSHQQLQHEVRWEDLILVSTCICLAMTLRATPSSGSPWNSWEGFSPYWLPISEKKLQVVVCKARPQLKILLKVGINFFVLRTIFCCPKRSVRNTLWTLLDFKNCKPRFPLSFWSPLRKDYHTLTTLVPCKCIPKFLSINVYVQPDRHQHFRLTCSLMDGSHVMVVIT